MNALVPMTSQSSLLRELHQRHIRRRMRIWAKGLSTPDLVVLHKSVVDEKLARQTTDRDSSPFQIEQIEALRSTWRAAALEVCDDYGFSLEDVQGSSRHGPLVRCRQAVMYRVFDKTNLSLPQIGQKLGGKDHTTVLHGIRRHAARHGLPIPRTEQPVEIPRFIGVPLSGECRA